jgi:AbrB family looped-hinge helix DNA binding protein
LLRSTIMKSRVSKRGYIVVPTELAKQIACKPGDRLDIDVKAGRIVVTPLRRKSRRKARIITDPITGLPVLTLGPGAPVLTHKEVKEMLADFP